MRGGWGESASGSEKQGGGGMSILKQLFDATHRADKTPEESDLDFAVRMGWDAKEEKRVADEERAAEVNAEGRRVDEYTPQEFAPSRFTFLVEAKPCVFCRKPTTADLKGGPFPVVWRVDFDSQRERAGIQKLAHWHDDGPVCVGCKEIGANDFACSHCKREQALSESHVSFGMPAEHLCATCYERVPAKKWAALVGELEEQHRYDFE
jgi:hypothetical protein